MSTTTTDAPAEKKEQAQTTYLAFMEQADGSYQTVGEVTVRAGRSDIAKQKTLEDLVKIYPDVESFTIAVVPVKSWQPQTYALEQPKPRFVAKG